MFGKKNQESIATGIVKPKTTALFFDKLWIPDGYEIYDEQCRVPNDVKINLENYCRSKEVVERQSLKFMSRVPYNSERELFEVHIMANRGHSRYGEDQESFLHNLEKESKIFISSLNRNKGLYELTSFYKRRYDIDILPIYLEPTQFDLEFQLMDSKKLVNTNPMVIISCELLPTIIEEKLEWEQVIDFKKDKRSVKKLRKFRNWANRELLEKDKTVIISEYEEALDNYKNAIKKHGIATTVGGFSTVLSSSALFLENIGEDVNMQIATGISIVAGLSSFTVNQYLGYREDRNTPIAYIYDTFKLAKLKKRDIED